MKKLFINLLLLSSISSCFALVSSTMERYVESSERIQERQPLSLDRSTIDRPSIPQPKTETQKLLERYTSQEDRIDQDQESLAPSDNAPSIKKTLARQPQAEISPEEYALETLMNLAQDIEQQINRSAFLEKLVAHKKEIDANQTLTKTTEELFKELAKEIAVGIVRTTGSFAVNQAFYHFLGIKNVRSPANELVTRGLEMAQLAGFSRTPSQIAAIALLFTNITNSFIDGCIRQAEGITAPIEGIILTQLTNTETQKLILDKALFFDSSDLAHNLLEKILLSQGMNNLLRDQIGLPEGHPLLWLHSHADMGIAGMRIYSLINEAKKQTYDFDLEKIFDGLENGTISVAEGTRMVQTMLSTMQEVTGLLQRVTKTDSKDAHTIQTFADSALTTMRSVLNRFQGEIASLNRMGAITGLAALADHPV
jgi:hypothetical protein